MTTHTTPAERIEDSHDAWEPEGPLGHDEAHVRLAPEDLSAALDEALGLKAISLRLQRSLVDDLKALAKSKGIGYQPLIRMVLTEYVTKEKGQQ